MWIGCSGPGWGFGSGFGLGGLGFGRCRSARNGAMWIG
jgi:hypothetical protein